MTQKAARTLADCMKSSYRDFTLEEIYGIVCREPRAENLTRAQLASRCSRTIGQARAILKSEGFVMIFGELRHSYRAEKRRRF